MNTLDPTLLKDFKNGETQAIEDFYFLFKKPVLRFILSMVKDPLESEAIFHEVFLKILRKRCELESEDRIRAYIFTITKNEVIDYFKSLKRDRERLENYFITRMHESSPEMIDAEENILNRLEGALHTLPFQRKKVLELSYYQDKSYQEIAEELGISKNTVKNHLIKARVNLRDRLS
ncbi:RNA polymerase sigma-70 factor, ECF subfamily [Algoriphagus alkaliphilus]|uniref:RNA polymerase sigma-70 factor, ECF subfamily n=1 Tax=Algoriphagus alkaliphilus TaxID=279824 RepID=A0A1G5VRK5_9BACT|nr:sigma-70 family RNA polymerase sigma factor [Algoriphagus alkaliphilus]MBA4301460.1 RNA polymerase sigma-70 factor [Cyclobacterium sp.]SDA47675.1 RNA polymerase sigma-70 factor, ECF subfamily [Algoriphagus alkaliphilus]